MTMTVKEIQTKAKCQCNHMFIDHNYTVKEAIHFGSCKNKDCNCEKFSPVPEIQNKASN